MDDVLLFSVQAEIGTFEIRTGRETFDITPQSFGQTYTLRLDSVPGFSRDFDSPDNASLAVVKHRTGLPQWDDDSKERISTWQRHLDKHFKINLLGRYLDMRPGCSYRDVVDYFYFKHRSVLSRDEITELLEELITTFQLDKPLRDHMTPAELENVARLARNWLEPEH